MTQPREPTDPPLTRTHIGAGVAAWTEEGAGPTVVMIHGMPGSVRDFRWLAPCLPGCHVVRLDLPGFGGTPVGTAGYGLSNLARHVERMLAALDLRDVMLVGHSFGNSVAMMTAANDPERVTRLGLISPVGMRPHRGFRNMIPPPALLSRALKVRITRPSLAKLIHRGAVQSGFPRSTPPDDFVQTMHHLARFEFAQVKEAVGRIKQPTAVFWADDDPLIESEIVEELGAALPSGPRARFPTGKHNPQKAHAVEIGAALRDFVGAHI